MSVKAQNLTTCRVLVSGHLPPPMGGIAMFYQSLLESSLPQKVDLHFVQTSSQKRTLADAGKASFSNLVSAIQDCARFLSAIEKYKPQIAHIATAPGFSFLKHGLCVLIADLAGSRVLIHPHCSLSALYTDHSSGWRWFVRQILRRCDGLIALSSEWRQISGIIPGLEVFLLPNAINQNDYKPIAEERSQRCEQPPVKNILYLGYLGKAKGSYDLIEAAKLVLSDRKDVVFHLVGDELAKGERASLQQQITTAGLNENVQLHLPVGYSEKLECFKRADIFVYPSYYEGMPMAVIEAMASGLPIVASNAGGLPDLVVDHENGLLTPPGNPQALANTLRTLIDEDGLCRSMQIQSRRMAAEKYDIEKLVEDLVGIYGKYVPDNNRDESRHSMKTDEIHAGETSVSANGSDPEIKSQKSILAAPLDTPWKVWNTFHSWLCLPVVRFMFLRKGIAWGRNWRFFGVPIIQKHRRSLIRFGDGMSLRSNLRSNPLGPNHPVFITAWQAGAVLTVGDHFAMTGGTLCAAERIEIGDHVTIGANVSVVDSDFHPIDPERRITHPNEGRTAPVIIGCNVFIGMDSLILKGVKIGEGSVIGAGSVVTRDVPPGVIAAGNPAHVIKEIGNVQDSSQIEATGGGNG